MPIQAPTNDEIAAVLEQIADQLERQANNAHRVQAFRHGAGRVRATQRPLIELVEQQGGEALKQIEGIGSGLATTIYEVIQTGRSSYLQQLQSQPAPAEIFRGVSGIGEKLAHKIALHLEITSLEALAQAAHDGRLAQVDGFGPKRTAAVRHSLATMLSHRRKQSGASDQEHIQPDVALLLEVDADYRRRAKADELPKLAPRRFNPKKEAWLPLMRTDCEEWTMTVLFSNTARAHELGKTGDWVVIYFQQDGPEDQCTVVTEFRGALKGKRVIRGRERECWQYYRDREASQHN